MAKFVGPKKVVVEGVEYTADHVMIAVGGTPSMPDVPGAELCINRHVVPPVVCSVIEILWYI